MNADLLALIGRLEAFEDYATERHMPPTYRKAAKEAIVRLVAMDSRLLLLEVELSTLRGYTMDEPIRPLTPEERRKRDLHELERGNEDDDDDDDRNMDEGGCNAD